MHASSEQFSKLNYIERGLSRLRMGTENSHMRFYDVTPWSYVNLDDPLGNTISVTFIGALIRFVTTSYSTRAKIK